MNKAKKLIKLVEMSDIKFPYPEMEKIMSGWITHWSGDHVELAVPSMPDVIIQAYLDGSWVCKSNREIIADGKRQKDLVQFLSDHFRLELKPTEPYTPEEDEKEEKE